MVRSLFISYDGLTDPLGRSQILPYLAELAQQHQIHVLSFEKPERYAKGAEQVREVCRRHNIYWHPLRFTRSLKLLGKPWDLLKMYGAAAFLSWRRGIQLLHCRSYLSAQVALPLRRLLGVRMLFDMRGFWVDERVDSGNWSLQGKGRLAYNLYRWVEKLLFRNADYVVSLTEAAIPRIRSLQPQRQCPIQVIPCCADFEFFRIEAGLREQGRRELGIASSARVLCYAGSLGSWYCFKEMLIVFRQLRELDSRWLFLVLSQDWGPECDALVAEVGPDLAQSIRIQSADREKMPTFLNAADLGISFIKPAGSKIASSPTKMAEYWACGLPVVCNAGIGDVQQQVESLEGGLCLPSLQDVRIDPVQVERLLALDGQQLRRKASEKLSLAVAGECYRSVYQRLEATV